MARPDPSWWRASPQDLQRVSERISTLYVERCHVDRDANGIVLVTKEQTVRFPAAMLAVLMLGPGTRVTHAAMTMLGDSGTATCWVGEQGVRFYAAGAGGATSSSLARRQAWLVSRRAERLAVARQMYAIRFPGEDVSRLTMQQLRGREGARVKNIYRREAERTGVSWKRREYKAGEAFGAGDDVNRLLSAGNACLYGLVHAAVAGIGAAPGLGFVHTGGRQSFVLDVADLYKAEATVPVAFDLASQGRVEERDMRLAMRDYFLRTRLLGQVVKDVKYLLMAEGLGEDDDDTNALWDDELGSVPGGLNWSERPEVEDNDFRVVSGPPIDEPPVPF